MTGILGLARRALDNLRETGAEPASQQPSVKQPPLEQQWLCGLDLGMMTDPTALAIVRKRVEKHDDGRCVSHYAVLHLQRWLGVDYPTMAEELRPMLARLSPPAALVGDETGVGVATLQILRRAKLPLGKLRGVCITAGHQTTLRGDGGWNVPKRELVAAAQSALQGGRLAIAPKLKDAKVLREELQTFQIKINAKSMVESFEAWRAGAHDDLVLAVCLAVWFGENAGRRLGAEHFRV